ncbi:MAG: hypothetical protein ACYC61_07175 [Isosphaeraceae bacterium]
MDELDLGHLHGWILDELASERPIGESMARLIDRCEGARPHPDWVGLRALRYDDLEPLVQWVQRPFRDEPPVRPLRGLWFGLFNPCYGGRNPAANLYVCGSERFSVDPDDKDWVVGPEWWPEDRYARSAVLADLYRIAYRQGASRDERTGCLGNDAEYPLCLGYGALAVRELLGAVEPSLLLGRADEVGVAVGFDSGDFVLLGRLVRDGLAPLGGSLDG